MKKYKAPIVKVPELVTIQFNNTTDKTDKSIITSFEGCEDKQVYKLALMMFSECKINTTIKLENHCPLSTISKSLAVTMTVRTLGNVESNGKTIRRFKGKSYNKTLYGITPAEASKYFEENYEKFL